jgi:nitric oxide reductase activation protein
MSEEMAARGSIGAHTQWSQCEDRTARTANARTAAEKRFETIVDPDGVLDPVERAKRANNARQAHMKQMARKSVQVRKRKQAQRLRDEAARIEAQANGDEIDVQQVQ